MIAGAGVGFYMVALPFEQLLLKFLLYQLHKTIGLTVFALAVTQIVLHYRRGRPAWESGTPRWQRRSARATHLALFGLLIATPLLGYLTAATAPAHIPTLFLGVLPIPHVVGVDRFWFGILRRVHLALAILILALATVHASAAVNHHRRGRRVLARMWRG